MCPYRSPSPRGLLGQTPKRTKVRSIGPRLGVVLLFAYSQPTPLLSPPLFETDEDLRKGDEALNAMNPEPGDEVGKRTSVEKYEVAVDVRL